MRLLALGATFETMLAELRGTTPETLPLFKSYADGWLGRHAASRSSRVKYGEAIERARAIHGKRIDAIGPAEFRTLTASLKGYAPTTAKQTVDVVKAILNDAADDGLPVSRPPRKVKTLRRPTLVRPGFAITRDQAEAIADAAPERFRAMFALWPWVGWRLGEAIAARKTDRKGTRLHITRQVRADGSVGPPKNGKPRYVDLTDGAIALLDELDAIPGELLFPGSTGRYLARRTVMDAATKAGAAAGVKDFTTHKWRHSFGSFLLEANCPSTYVAARMGDDISTVMKTYAHEIEAADSRGPEALRSWASGDVAGDGD